MQKTADEDYNTWSRAPHLISLVQAEVQAELKEGNGVNVCIEVNETSHLRVCSIQ